MTENPTVAPPGPEGPPKPNPPCPRCDYDGPGLPDAFHSHGCRQAGKED